MTAEDVTAEGRPVAATGQRQCDLLAGHVLENRGTGLYAYAYRLTLSDDAAAAALRHTAAALRTGRPPGLDEKGALDLARAEVGRVSLQLGTLEQTEPAPPVLDEDDLLRSGFHRRLHALPTIERQCWLLRHTGGHDIDCIAELLRIPVDRVQTALASAAQTLVAGELAECAHWSE